MLLRLIDAIPASQHFMKTPDRTVDPLDQGLIDKFRRLACTHAVRAGRAGRGHRGFQHCVLEGELHRPTEFPAL